ncbi:MAG: hypothetical protein U1F10_04185 [Burkholderiales bacterium]
MCAFSEDVQMLVMPSVSWAYANDASTSNALNYGARWRSCSAASRPR